MRPEEAWAESEATRLVAAQWVPRARSLIRNLPDALHEHATASHPGRLGVLDEVLAQVAAERDEAEASLLNPLDVAEADQEAERLARHYEPKDPPRRLRSVSGTGYVATDPL